MVAAVSVQAGLIRGEAARAADRNTVLSKLISTSRLVLADAERMARERYGCINWPIAWRIDDPAGYEIYVRLRAAVADAEAHVSIATTTDHHRSNRGGHDVGQCEPVAGTNGTQPASGSFISGSVAGSFGHCPEHLGHTKQNTSDTRRWCSQPGCTWAAEWTDEEPRWRIAARAAAP